MKNKVSIMIISALLVMSLTASVIGLVYNNKKSSKNVEPIKTKVTITYEYYLDNQLQDKMPLKEYLLDKDKNETDKLKYVFDRYTCTNGLNGAFNKDKWIFSVDQTNLDTTCQVYFVNSTYNANVTVANGIAEIDSAVINREGSAEFKITPTEGYVFKNVSCSNNKEAKWDESTKTLSIDVIIEDVACKVTFEISELNVELKVNNGEGETVEKKKYGDTVQLIVTPHDGFSEPYIECSNDQIGVFADNKFTIEKLTNNTTCTISFNKTQPKTYMLKINSLPETTTITSGSLEQNIEAGKDAKITVKPDKNEELKISCVDSIVPSILENPDGTISYTFYSISKDITCDITSTPKAQPPVNE